MRTAAHLLVLAAAVLGACGREPEAPQAGPRPEPIVIYAAHGSSTYPPELLANFTRETGIRVTVRNGTPAEIVANVIADRGSPPADVLLTSDVVGIARAADEGALRPLRGGSLVEILAERVPPQLRDPDGFWVAARVRIAAIAYDSRVVDPVDLEGYAGLADERFRGRLCLSSATLPVNRTLIAMLIDELGVRPAEIVVRGWVANLALPVFDNESELLAAIEDGRCQLGIASMPAAAGSAGGGAVRWFEPQPAYADIDGLGIARHAREPDAAMRLVEWLLEAQDNYADASRIGERNIGVAAWHAADADKLVERAGYR